VLAIDLISQIVPKSFVHA